MNEMLSEKEKTLIPTLSESEEYRSLNLGSSLDEDLKNMISEDTASVAFVPEQLYTEGQMMDIYRSMVNPQFRVFTIHFIDHINEHYVMLAYDKEIPSNIDTFGKYFKTGLNFDIFSKTLHLFTLKFIQDDIADSLKYYYIGSLDQCNIMKRGAFYNVKMNIKTGLTFSQYLNFAAKEIYIEK